ncbi:hypothetical protein FA10DRAFT_277870 [Acaromyces ingoldii]|uniref:Ser-Thr-rich glycosyl-phosphatidyl-inositol-anchored membrane family-domain-containing protein n=1 Tax=Acaromyces ingoldii TaxID=215250 RepID=A0A316Z288_9BASI|nr:hypothetical protein FA10DRAFT_277870 [Acaromyces ingoldii]PWN94293.1 hypothetical protein FA10DRAFT_277870 [Acaromyces ingoldii]
MSRLLSLASLAFLLLLPLVTAFEVVFPGGKAGGYWVSNATNLLRWTNNGSESQLFSVELLNANSSSLNGNFQIANALPSANQTAVIVLDMIPAGTYRLPFVNPNNYTLNKPELYYTSPEFEIKKAGTSPSPALNDSSVSGPVIAPTPTTSAPASTTTSPSTLGTTFGTNNTEKSPTATTTTVAPLSASPNSNTSNSTASSSNRGGQKENASLRMWVDVLALGTSVVIAGLISVL